MKISLTPPWLGFFENLRLGEGWGEYFDELYNESNRKIGKLKTVLYSISFLLRCVTPCQCSAPSGNFKPSYFTQNSFFKCYSKVAVLTKNITYLPRFRSQFNSFSYNHLLLFSNVMVIGRRSGIWDDRESVNWSFVLKDYHKNGWLLKKKY